MSIILSAASLRSMVSSISPKCENVEISISGDLLSIEPMCIQHLYIVEYYDRIISVMKSIAVTAQSDTDARDQVRSRFGYSVVISTIKNTEIRKDGTVYASAN